MKEPKGQGLQWESKRIKLTFPAFGGYRTIVSDIPNIQTSKMYQDDQKKPVLGDGTGWSKNRGSRLFAKLPRHFLARLQDTFTLYRSKGVETCRSVARCCYSLFASHKLNISLSMFQWFANVSINWLSHYVVGINVGSEFNMTCIWRLPVSSHWCGLASPGITLCVL